MKLETCTKDELKLGGPGLRGYAYQADVYCVGCAHAIIDDMPWKRLSTLDTGNTECVPVPMFFPESDCAEHCAQCGEYLYGPQSEDETN